MVVYAIVLSIGISLVVFGINVLMTGSDQRFFRNLPSNAMRQDVSRRVTRGITYILPGVGIIVLLTHSLIFHRQPRGGVDSYDFFRGPLWIAFLLLVAGSWSVLSPHTMVNLVKRNHPEMSPSETIKAIVYMRVVGASACVMAIVLITHMSQQLGR